MSRMSQNRTSQTAILCLHLVLAIALEWLAPAQAKAQIQVALDYPGNGMVLAQPFPISGWAVDLQATGNSGIDQVAVYASGPIGSQILLGYAIKESRPDVAQHFGRPAYSAESGYRFTVNSLPAGVYQFGVLAHSAITGAWSPPYITSATIPASPTVALDPIPSGVQPFVFSGLAGDPLSASGAGISAVHVHAEPIGGGAPFLIGGARIGLTRPDAAAQYGPNYLNSGWDFSVRGLPPGQYRLHAYALGSASNLWGGVQSAPLTIVNDVRMLVETPTTNALVQQPFSIAGATADLATLSGTGVSLLHIYAQRVSTGEYTFLGQATPNIARPDLGVYVGGNPQFTNIGFRLDDISGLSPDTYDIVVFALSTVSNQFHGFATRIRLELRAAAPTLSPPPGEYSAPVTVVAASGTPGAVVRYTVDGSEPTEASPALAPSFVLGGPGGAKLRAFAPGWLPSATVQADYVFRAATPALSPPPGTYDGPVTVSASSATPGASIRVTMAGEPEPTGESAEITGPITLSSSVTAQVRAFRSGWLPSGTLSAAYIIRPAAPTFSVPSGTYSRMQIVTMQTATPGGSIRYTTNGDPPTATSTAYAGPLTIARPLTVRARTFGVNGDASSESSLVISYAAAPASVSPSSGTYTQAPVLVSVSSATPEASLRYTLDGSEPGPSSVALPPGGSVTIDRSRTLKIKPFVEGWPDGQTTVANYQFVVPDPVVSPASGVYGRPFAVLADSPGAVLRYSTDGGAPTSTSPVWNGFNNPANGVHTLTFRAFRDGWSESQLVQRTYHISDAVTVSPTLSPAPGVYDLGVVVSASHSDAYVTIRITTDGTEPSELSPVYSGPITLTTPTVVKARAFKAGAVPSNPVGGDYRLRLRAPTVTPQGGTFASAPHPVAAHSDGTVTLRYTTDRTEPSEQSPVVPQGCCAVSDNTTIKVAAFKTGWAQSAVVTNTYLVGTQVLPVSTSSMLRLSPVGEVAPVGDPLRIDIGGTPVLPNSVQVVRNGVDLTANAQITGTRVVVPNFVVSGRNDVEISALDAGGAALGEAFSVFGAANRLNITVRSQTGGVLAGAAIELSDVTQAWPTQTATTDLNGVASVAVPTGFGGMASIWAAGFHTLVAPVSGATTVFLEPVNENFERAAADWTMSYPQGAFIDSHVEGLVQWCSQQTQTCMPYIPTGWAADALGPIDNDLIITNYGSPSGASLSRTIRLEPGTRIVKLRYRFVSYWAPSSYQMRLSIPGGGPTLTHAYSMQNLQAQGIATPGVNYLQSNWIEMVLNVPAGAEELQVEGTLGPDGAYHTERSWLNVDFVQLQGVQMLAAKLVEWGKDTANGSIKEMPLEFISLGQMDPGSRATQISGVIAFSGSPDSTKRISAIRLDVSRSPSGTPVFTVPLKTAVATGVLGTPFPGNGVLTTGATRELFELTANQMAQFSQTAEESVFLRVRAFDESGHEISSVAGAGPRSVTKLTDVTSDVSRDGGRDTGVCLGTTWTCYGDAWARPALHRLIRAVQQTLNVAVPGVREAIPIRLNDFSNSNGGHFPIHSFHTQGRHVDGDIDNILTKDAALARKLAHVVRVIHAKMLENGTFSGFDLVIECNMSNLTDPFTAAIRAEPDLNGVPLWRYFRNGGRSHRDHFHVQVR